MRRERPRIAFEFPSQLKRASFIVAKPDPPSDNTALIYGGVFAVILIGLYLVFRRKKARRDALNKLPWVGRDNRKWFANIRTRAWTTVNYELALQTAYDTVLSPLVNNRQCC
jgi:LPXTG-motif cell wall-anchored protein